MLRVETETRLWRRFELSECTNEYPVLGDIQCRSVSALSSFKMTMTGQEIDTGDDNDDDDDDD